MKFFGHDADDEKCSCRKQAKLSILVLEENPLTLGEIHLCPACLAKLDLTLR